MQHVWYQRSIGKLSKNRKFALFVKEKGRKSCANTRSSRQWLEAGYLGDFLAFKLNRYVPGTKMGKNTENSHFRFLWERNRTDFQCSALLDMCLYLGMYFTDRICSIDGVNIHFSIFSKISTSSFCWGVPGPKNDPKLLTVVRWEVNEYSGIVCASLSSGKSRFSTLFAKMSVT